MNAVDVGPHAGVDVADQGTVVPAIPQSADGRGKIRRHLAIPERCRLKLRCSFRRAIQQRWLGLFAG